MLKIGHDKRTMDSVVDQTWLEFDYNVLMVGALIVLWNIENVIAY